MSRMLEQNFCSSDIKVKDLQCQLHNSVLIYCKIQHSSVFSRVTKSRGSFSVSESLIKTIRQTRTKIKDISEHHKPGRWRLFPVT